MRLGERTITIKRARELVAALLRSMGGRPRKSDRRRAFQKLKTYVVIAHDALSSGDRRSAIDVLLHVMSPADALSMTYGPFDTQFLIDFFSHKGTRRTAIDRARADAIMLAAGVISPEEIRGEYIRGERIEQLIVDDPYSHLVNVSTENAMNLAIGTLVDLNGERFRVASLAHHENGSQVGLMPVAGPHENEELRFWLAIDDNGNLMLWNTPNGVARDVDIDIHELARVANRIAARQVVGAASVDSV